MVMCYGNGFRVVVMVKVRVRVMAVVMNSKLW